MIFRVRLGRSRSGRLSVSGVLQVCARGPGEWKEMGAGMKKDMVPIEV